MYCALHIVRYEPHSSCTVYSVQCAIYTCTGDEEPAGENIMESQENLKGDRLF